MINIKRQQIIDLFTKYGNQEFSLWFSGIKGEGTYKRWQENGQLYIRCFYKNSKLNGEFKRWHINGELSNHILYKNSEAIKDYLK